MPSDAAKLLSQTGRDQVCLLKEQLARLNLNPEIYLTSRKLHANETANILARHVNGNTKVVPLEALTPGKALPSNNVFESVINQAKEQGVELTSLNTIAIVGHNESPTLGEILGCLASTKSVHRYLGYAEPVWVRANSLADLLHRKGVVQDWASANKVSGTNIGGPGPER